MAAGDEFVAYVLELLAPLGHPRSRRMFGGHGIYVDDLFVAIIAFERLYLKVDDQTRAAFETAHCEAFTYDGSKGEVHAMSYWTAPADALESSDEMRPWARRAIEAALRAKAAAKPKRAKAAKKSSGRSTGAAAKPARGSTKRSGTKR
jgi:DNA transformation protein and related proteins